MTGISAMFVCFLLPDIWQSSLRGVRSCDRHRGPGPGFGLLELFVVGFGFEV